MLFLLMQVMMARRGWDGVGVKGPWTEYVKMLPEKVLLPTTWGEGEMGLLIGTSLEVSWRIIFTLLSLFTFTFYFHFLLLVF